MGFERLPDELMARVAARTDAKGRVNLPAASPDTLSEVRITAKDFGIQVQQIQLVEKRQPRTIVGYTIRLRPVGKIEGRVISSRPEAARDVRLIFSALPGSLFGRHRRILFGQSAAGADRRLCRRQVRQRRPLRRSGAGRGYASGSGTGEREPALASETARYHRSVAGQDILTGDSAGSHGRCARRRPLEGHGKTDSRRCWSISPTELARGPVRSPTRRATTRPACCRAASKCRCSPRPKNTFNMVRLGNAKSKFPKTPKHPICRRRNSFRPGASRAVWLTCTIGLSRTPRIFLSDGNRSYGYGDNSDSGGKFTLLGVPKTIDPTKAEYKWSGSDGVPHKCEVVKTSPLVLRALH